MKWNLYSEVKPPKNENVLITLELENGSRVVTISSYSRGYHSDYAFPHDDTGKKVISWASLPIPDNRRVQESFNLKSAI